MFCFFVKWAIPWLFLIYFSSFKANIAILTKNICEKCFVHSVYGTGFQTHDLWNMSRIPITTKQWFLP